MAVNYYEGWTEAELLALRKTVQATLATGRPVEVSLAGERVRMDDKQGSPPEVTLERIAYALYQLYVAGETTTDTVYQNPYGYQPGVTLQARY